MTAHDLSVTVTDVGRWECTVADLDGTWWWCMKHERPELYENTDSPDRLGPFATESEAAKALKTIADREEKYDKEAAEDD